MRSPSAFELEVPDEELDEELDARRREGPSSVAAGQRPRAVRQHRTTVRRQTIGRTLGMKAGENARPGCNAAQHAQQRERTEKDRPDPARDTQTREGGGVPDNASRVCDQLRSPEIVRHEIHACGQDGDGKQNNPDDWLLHEDL